MSVLTVRVHCEHSQQLIRPLACGIGLAHALSQISNGVQLTANPVVIMWFGAFSGFTVLPNVYAVVLITWKAW